MANPSIVVLPQPAAPAPSGPATMLALGRELVARVASISADGTMLLKIGPSLIAARSDEQLKAGDVLRLQVSEAGPDKVVLKLLPPAQSPPPAQGGRPGEPKAPVSFELPLAELQPLADELDRQTARAQAPPPAAAQARTPAPASPALPPAPGQPAAGSQKATAELPVPQLEPSVSPDGDEPAGLARQTRGTPTAPAPSTREPATASPSGRAAAPPTALRDGVVVQGRVVADEQGRLLLRLPSGARLPLPEQVQRTLTAGQMLEAAVKPAPPEASKATVELRPLPPPTDQRAALVRQVTDKLAPQLGARTAAGIAEFVAARGVSAGDAPLLAARLLAQQFSPVEVLRQLAVARPKARALLQSIEEDLVSGDPHRVRSALSRLGLDQEKQLAQGKLTEPTTMKSLAGPEGETAVSAQQVLLLKPGSEPVAPVFLFLPLPEGGQARLVVEDNSQQERSDGHFSLRGELDLARTGTVSFHLLAVEQGASLLLKSPDSAVVDHLSAETQPLVDALERALGIPVSATVTQSAEEAASLIAFNFEKTDLYA